MSSPSGQVQLVISGTLADIINNFSKLITNLQAQGINPSPLQTAQVQISLGLGNASQTEFNSFETAISNFRSQVTGSSIKATITFTILG